MSTEVAYCGIQLWAYALKVMSQRFSDKSQGYSRVAEAVVGDWNPPRTCQCIYLRHFSGIIWYADVFWILSLQYPVWWCIKHVTGKLQSSLLCDRPSARSQMKPATQRLRMCYLVRVIAHLRWRWHAYGAVIEWWMVLLSVWVFYLDVVWIKYMSVLSSSCSLCNDRSITSSEVSSAHSDM
jgi:hypothetical protein